MSLYWQFFYDRRNMKLNSIHYRFTRVINFSKIILYFTTILSLSLTLILFLSHSFTTHFLHIVQVQITNRGNNLLLFFFILVILSNKIFHQT